MKRRYTSIFVVLFGLLLTGFVNMEYQWFLSFQDRELEDYKLQVRAGLAKAVEQDPPLTPSLQSVAFARLLRKALTEQGLPAFAFEFSFSSPTCSFRSPGFSAPLVNDVRHVVVQCPIPSKGGRILPGSMLTVVIPGGIALASAGTGWIIAGCAVVTVLLVVTFCFVVVLLRRSYLSSCRSDERLNSELQELKVPIATISLAVDALRHNQIANDPERIKHFQHIIDTERMRIDEMSQNMRGHKCKEGSV